MKRVWTGGRIKVRCRSRAQHRKTLKQPPSWYVQEPKCHCGKTFRIDGYRSSGKENQDTRYCSCDGIEGAFALNTTKRTKAWTKHKYGQGKCIHREEHVLSMVMRESLPMHSPIRNKAGKPDNDCPF